MMTLTSDTTFNVVLRPGTNVSGRVNEAGAGPLNDVLLEILTGPNAGRTAMTSGPVDGTYFFRSLVPGEFRMRASKPGFEAVEAIVDAIASTFQDFTLRRR